MLEYTIGVMRDGGRPRRYLRIKSDEAIQVLDPVVSFTREQEDKRSVYECIIGDLIREAQEGGFFYEWYELESVLVEVDHTLPVAATVQRMGPEATIAAAKIARLTLPGLDLDDGQRIAVSALYEDWTPGVDYEAGDVRNADGQTWECFQGHNAAEHPDISPEGTAWRTFWRPLHPLWRSRGPTIHTRRASLWSGRTGPSGNVSGRRISARTTTRTPGASRTSPRPRRRRPWTWRL